MGNLADEIERYLKGLLQNNPRGVLEVQRCELARIFACVPSQINYVLTTRFSDKQGFMVESRRGGGGYLRIRRLSLNRDEGLQRLTDRVVGSSLSQVEAEGLLEWLWHEGVISRREWQLARALSNGEALPLKQPEQDLVRACQFRVLLRELLGDERPWQSSP